MIYLDGPIIRDDAELMAAAISHLVNDDAIKKLKDYYKIQVFRQAEKERKSDERG